MNGAEITALDGAKLTASLLLFFSSQNWSRDSFRMVFSHSIHVKRRHPSDTLCRCGSYCSLIIVLRSNHGLTSTTKRLQSHNSVDLLSAVRDRKQVPMHIKIAMNTRNYIVFSHCPLAYVTPSLRILDDRQFSWSLARFTKTRLNTYMCGYKSTLTRE